MTSAALFSLFIPADKCPLITNCNFCCLSTLETGEIIAEVGRLGSRAVIQLCPFHELQFVFHVSLWELPKLPGFVMTLPGWGFQAWQSCPGPACPSSMEPGSSLGQAGMGGLQTGRVSVSSLLGCPREGQLIIPHGNYRSLRPTFVGLNQEKGEIYFPSPGKTGSDKIFAYRNNSGKYGQTETLQSSS